MAILDLKKRIREMNGGLSLEDQAAGRTVKDGRSARWSRDFYSELDSVLRAKGVGGSDERYGKRGKNDANRGMTPGFQRDKETKLPGVAGRLVGGVRGADGRMAGMMRDMATRLSFDEFKDRVTPIKGYTAVENGKETTIYDISSPAYSVGTDPRDKYTSPEAVRDWVNGVKISDSAAGAVADAATSAVSGAVDADPTRYRAGDSQAYKDFKATIGGVDSSTQAVGAPSPNGTYSAGFLEKSKALSEENRRFIDSSRKQTADDAGWARGAARELGVEVDLDMSDTPYRRRSLEEIRADVERKSAERRAKWREEHAAPGQGAGSPVPDPAPAPGGDKTPDDTEDGVHAADKAGRSYDRGPGAYRPATGDLDDLLSLFPREDSLDELLYEDR